MMFLAGLGETVGEAIREKRIEQEMYDSLPTKLSPNMQYGAWQVVTPSSELQRTVKQRLMPFLAELGRHTPYARKEITESFLDSIYPGSSSSFQWRAKLMVGMGSPASVAFEDALVFETSAALLKAIGAGGKVPAMAVLAQRRGLSGGPIDIAVAARDATAKGAGEAAKFMSTVCTPEAQSAAVLATTMGKPQFEAERQRLCREVAAMLNNPVPPPLPYQNVQAGPPYAAAPSWFAQHKNVLMGFGALALALGVGTVLALRRD